MAKQPEAKAPAAPATKYFRLKRKRTGWTIESAALVGGALVIKEECEWDLYRNVVSKLETLAGAQERR